VLAGVAAGTFRLDAGQHPFDHPPLRLPGLARSGKERMPGLEQVRRHLGRTGEPRDRREPQNGLAGLVGRAQRSEGLHGLEQQTASSFAVPLQQNTGA
jgi:hypothetical protein